MNYELRTTNYKKIDNKNKLGQAMVTLLIFMIISIMVTTAGVGMILVNSQSSNTLTQGIVTPVNAESGIENSLIRLLRDPNYAGETFSLGTTIVVVTVTGTTIKTITSTATNGNFKRTVQATADYTNEVLTVTEWREIF